MARNRKDAVDLFDDMVKLLNPIKEAYDSSYFGKEAVQRLPLDSSSWCCFDYL